MMHVIIFTAMLNISEFVLMPSKPVEIEVRKRHKGDRKRRRGGNGVR